jgi:flagellar basal-body rod modification protein FlgD
MGSIANIYQQTDAAGLTASNASGAVGTNALSNTSAFLQLLIAQLHNQDPTQPVDPTTFVTQLAEFNDVEQNLGSRQDLDAISEKYLGVTTPPSVSGASTAVTNTLSGTDSAANATSSLSSSHASS